MIRAVTTPCVGICSSGIGDDVCRGCKRFAHEVIDWNAYTVEQRGLVLGRLEKFLIQIIKIKIELIDIKLLFSSIKKADIPFDASRDPHYWLYEVFRSSYRQPIDPAAWGFNIRSSYRHLSLTALQQVIEMEFFELSKAHYERYIAPGIVSAP